jgi:zinc transporter
MDLSIDAPRTDGLAWAFAFPPDAPPVLGDPRPVGGPGWDWLHYDLVNSRSRAAIEAERTLPHFARLVLIGTDETPRIVHDETVVAGVLPSFVRSGGPDDHEIAWWRFAMVSDRLVTSRRRPSRALADVWESLRAGGNAACPAALLFLAIADFAREARRRVAALDDELDATEDALLDQRSSADLGGLGSQVGQARREVTTIKRALTPLARLLAEDAEEMPAWATHDSQDGAHNVVLSALDDIAALHDRARALQDELTARLAEETNRRLYIVSVVTTLVMPATLVTGFFGMNTGGLLWLEQGHGTFYAFCVCLVAIFGTLALLRWKRLL